MLRLQPRAGNGAVAGVLAREIRPFKGKQESRIEVMLPSRASIYLEIDARDTADDLRLYVANRLGVAPDGLQVFEWIGFDSEVGAEDWLVPHLIYSVRNKSKPASRRANDRTPSGSERTSVTGELAAPMRKQVQIKTHQTGDVPHVAAALLHDPMIDVVVKVERGHEARGEDFKQTFLRAVGGARGASRIRVVADGTEVSRQYDIGSGHTRAAKKMNLGHATSIVAEAYKSLGASDFYARNRKSLAAGSSEIPEEDIVAFMLEHGLDLRCGAQRQRYLLVWSRYSGRNAGGYNPIGDSSRAGNAQLVQIGARVGRTVITVGHDPPSRKLTPRGTVHLGEYWADSRRGNPFLGKGRPGQNAFYALLMDRHDVVQVGQKTGGMDNAALIGMRTVYLEDAESAQRARMAKWSNVMHEYRGVIVALPPKALGKYLRTQKEDMKERDEARVSEIKKELSYEKLRSGRGYSQEDQDEIVTQLKRLD